MTSTGKIRSIRWGPWWRRQTVVQPWTCLWVIAAHPQLRCAGCDGLVTTRQCLVATFPSRAAWQQGDRGSPHTGVVYCGNCARVWYGIGAADLQPPLPASQIWDCWGPLVSLSRLMVDGPTAHPRYAYRLSRQWRNRLLRYS